MKLHVEWVPNPRYWEGGSYAIMKANNQVMAWMPTYGHDARTLYNAVQMVAAFNNSLFVEVRDRYERTWDAEHDMSLVAIKTRMSKAPKR